MMKEEKGREGKRRGGILTIGGQNGHLKSLWPSALSNCLEYWVLVDMPNHLEISSGNFLDCFVEL